MDKNRHLEVSSLGGKNKFENYSATNVKNEESSSSSIQKLEDILNTLDRKNNEQ